MEYLNDTTTEAMRIGLISLFSKHMEEKQFSPSKGLMEAFVEVEGEGTSFIPELDYKYVRHIEIPRDYASGNAKVDAKFTKEMAELGIHNDVVEAVRDDMSGYFDWEYNLICQKMKSPEFKFLLNESIEDALKREQFSHFPLTYIFPEAVRFESPHATYTHRLKSTIYSMATQMPPHHLSGPLYTSYIETCMRVMCCGMKMTNESQLFFTFRVIAAENKIVFFVCALHGKNSVK
jgi:hypothetical protein